MSVVTRATAKTYFETNDVPTQAQFEDLIDSTLFPGDQDTVLLTLQALGSAIIAQTVGVPSPSWITTSVTLSTNVQHFTPVYLAKAATITGVKFFQIVSGVFTAGTSNAIILYSYSGGTLTRQATSANDANIWKGTSSEWQTVAFTTPYVAAAGLYYVGYIYGSAGTTSAPTIGSVTTSNAQQVNTVDFTDSAKLHASINSSGMAASYLMSALSASINRFYAGLY
jgi:hypothetical protein